MDEAQEVKGQEAERINSFKIQFKSYGKIFSEYKKEINTRKK